MNAADQALGRVTQIELGRLQIAVNATLVAEDERDTVTASSFLAQEGIHFTHKLSFQASTSAASALDVLIDSSTRLLATGFADGTIYIYDLMNKSAHQGAIATIDPLPMIMNGPNLGITDLAWSIDPTDGTRQLLVGTSGFNCRIYKFSKSMKPDLVRATTFGIEGMRNPYANKGHVAPITKVGWIIDATHNHPNRFFSASLDGTVRVHNNDAKGTNAVIKHGQQSPFSPVAPVNTAKYVRIGSKEYIFSAGEDGVIQMWDLSKIYAKKPALHLKVEAGICGLDVFERDTVDDTLIAVLCRNDTFAIYSAKDIAKPIAEHKGIPSSRRGTCAVRFVSSDDLTAPISVLVATGDRAASHETPGMKGGLAFFTTAHKQCMLKLADSSIRQIQTFGYSDGALFASCESGEVVALYQARFDSNDAPGGYSVSKWVSR